MHLKHKYTFRASSAVAAPSLYGDGCSTFSEHIFLVVSVSLTEISCTMNEQAQILLGC